MKDTVSSTTIYLHGTSYKRKHTDTQQESIIYFVMYSYFLFCFVSGAACFFVKHVQTGMCIHVTSVLQTNENWGNLTFVELSNNCLDPAAQSRFLDNSAMLNFERKGCFEGTFRHGYGYYISMLYLLVATDPLANCRDQDHAITQTSWGGLSVYYKSHAQMRHRTRCAVPETNYGLVIHAKIDRYIGLTTKCNDAEDKRFNFGKCLFSMQLIWLMSLGASVAQSSEQAPFTSEIVGSILATDSCEKSQSTLAESRGFSPGAPVSSHRES